MSTKRNRPTDRSNDSDLSSDRGNKRLTNSSREINRNEEQSSPSGRNRASDQGRQSSQDLDRSTGRQAQKPERPESSQNQGTGNQTTGSDRPGSEISDQAPSTEPWSQTSRDQYPTHSKSSPHVEQHDAKAQPHMQEKSDRRMQTGNSERTGQQYSDRGNSSQSRDRIMSSGHPANDRELSSESRDKRKSKSANQGTKQSSGESGTRGNRQDRMNQDDQVFEE